MKGKPAIGNLLLFASVSIFLLAGCATPSREGVLYFSQGITDGVKADDWHTDGEYGPEEINYVGVDATIYITEYIGLGVGVSMTYEKDIFSGNIPHTGGNEFKLDRLTRVVAPVTLVLSYPVADFFDVYAGVGWAYGYDRLKFRKIASDGTTEYALSDRYNAIVCEYGVRFYIKNIAIGVGAKYIKGHSNLLSGDEDDWETRPFDTTIDSWGWTYGLSMGMAF
ncbi:hypothetical protein RsTz2092_06260 [Deferribacterales bacterium RsTz2092]